LIAGREPIVRLFGAIVAIALPLLTLAQGPVTLR
jgi:hypothetical protein